MDISRLIANAEARLTAARAAYDQYHTEQRNLLDEATGDSLDEAAQSRFDSLMEQKRNASTEVDSASAALDQLRAQQTDDERLQRAAEVSQPNAERNAPGVVTREPRTYNEGNRWERSFFRDMYGAEYVQDYGARERINKHRIECERDGKLAGFDREQRAGTTGGFQGLVPPQYLVDEAALVARAGRPTANVVRHLPLPAEGMSLIIPKGTTGVTEAIQATENASVSNTDQVWSNVTVPVVTIAGQQDVSRQSLERATGIDSLIYSDLAAAYNVALDVQVLSGTGSSGQALGILQTGGVNQATAFGAAATPATFYSKLAGQLNAVETTRMMAPDLIIMHPRRWNWLVAQLDSSNRPLVVPNASGPNNALGVYDVPQDTPSAIPVGHILGLPVITDASIPGSVGTGPEDQVIVARWEDLLLWENGDGAPFQLRFEQTLGNQLTVKLVAYNYAAFTAGRFPTAVGIVGGNAGSAGFGLVAPTF
ncbi:phage major capsid protein [Leifsonia sp. NPDC056824]|uniref:phage major capsid protein n=1 Tax=Leifsonia sp. NPDC056824 TaxID=3345953 RepID=UPI0036A4FCE3